jgi:general L-amino acid transport system permease protein
VLGRVLGSRMPLRAGRKMPLVYLAAVVGCYFLLVTVVPLQLWGGLLLTVTVAAAGILLSFPFGVLLGLGRRSSFPVFRFFSVVYIETIRGVPLITLLFIGSVTIGLFLPPDAGRLDLVVRALVAIVLFSAAYMAETVRGGLQSVPKGQTEAAMAIGLSPIKTTALIVLPQALRNVIPTIVGQFISLWKDTSLLAGIGLLEILGITQAVLVQEEFRGQGLQGEVFAFAAFLYWTACYFMSRASQRLEARLGVGER